MKHLNLYSQLTQLPFNRLQLAMILSLLPAVQGCRPEQTVRVCSPEYKPVYSGPKSFLIGDLTGAPESTPNPPEVFRLSAGHFNGAADPNAYEIYYFVPVTGMSRLTVEIIGKRKEKGREVFLAEFAPIANDIAPFTSSTSTPYFYETTAESKNTRNLARISVPATYFSIPREFSMSGTGAVQFDFSAKWAAGTTTVVVPCDE